MTVPIKKAVIEVFGGCNYTCQMCPHSFNEGREKSFLRALNYKLYIDILNQLQDSEVQEIFLEGSGEPTLNKRMPEFIQAGVDRGFKMSFITNGSKMTGSFMNDIVDAGMHFARFSVTGYNAETYKQWMSQDLFYFIRDNANETIDYIASRGSKASIGSYHLILDNNNVEFEIDNYINNWVNHVPGIKASIWKMHNWSGVYDEVTWRKRPEKRSCGRPFSPDIIIRAGGNDGKQGAVVPCCMVLGQDSKAVLGHTSEQSIEQIFNGEAYEHLREMHRQHMFDEIDYCKNCDMLYEAPESLVWSNFDTSYHVLTGGLFDMRQYRI
jgi:organic radical activating enzyme